MPTLHELDTALRDIRRKCKESISSDTGEVDYVLVNEQAELLKQWIHNFETLYIAEAKDNPVKSAHITEKGHEIAEEAWFTYEVLVAFGMVAGEPEPTAVRWEALPEGNVPAALKVQAITQIVKLYNMLANYRSDATTTIHTRG